MLMQRKKNVYKGINAENAALIFHQHFESHLPFQHSVSQYRHIPEFYVCTLYPYT